MQTTVGGARADNQRKEETPIETIFANDSVMCGKLVSTRRPPSIGHAALASAACHSQSVILAVTSMMQK